MNQKSVFFLTVGAALAAAALLLVVWGGAGGTPKALADNYDYSWDLVLCDGAGGENDNPKCNDSGGTAVDVGGTLGVIEEGDHPEMQWHLKVDPNSTGGVAGTVMASSLFDGIEPALPGAIAEGDEVGKIEFRIDSSATIANSGTSGINAGTGQPDVCGVPGTIDIEGSLFELYMAELGAGDGVDNDGDCVGAPPAEPPGPCAVSGGIDEEILDTLDNDGDTLVDEDNRTVSVADDDLDGKVQEFEDNVGENCIPSYDAVDRPDGHAWGTDPNGIYDGVDCLQEPLFSGYLPDYAETIGVPNTRAFGKACILPTAGVCLTRVAINYFVFDFDLDADSLLDEHLSFTTVGYPGAVPYDKPDTTNLTDQTTLTCAPWFSSTRIFGITQGNTAACHECTGSPNPSIAGGVINWTAGAPSGDEPYSFLTTLGLDENPDGDLAAASWETCSQTISVDTDLEPAHADPDFDRWDSACDPVPGSSDNDGSGAPGLLSYNLPAAGTWPMDPENCNQTGYGFVGGWDCDQDVDGDGWLNTVDNCPLTPQGDTTEDGMEDGSGPVAEGTGDCYDGVDNDGDGTPGIDMNEDGTVPDPLGTGNCADTVDNDGDVMIDANDPDCAASIDHGDTDCAPFIDWQWDRDSDNVGDVCDTAAPDAPDVRGDGDGYIIDAHPHGLVGGGFPLGDPPGYHSHNDLCGDEFTVYPVGGPGVGEQTGGGVCPGLDGNPTVDSDADGTLDWFDEDSSNTYTLGETMDPSSDSDGDTYTDACEAVVGFAAGPPGSDPLEFGSTPAYGGASPGLDCDGDQHEDGTVGAPGDEQCTDGIDNDGVEGTDGDDPDCANNTSNPGMDAGEETSGTNPFPILLADIAVESFTANDPPPGYPDPELDAVHYILPVSVPTTVTLDEVKHNYGPEPTVADVTWEAVGFVPAEVNVNWVPELGDECTFDGGVVDCITGDPATGDINDLHFEVPLPDVSEDVTISRNIIFHCKVPGTFTGQLNNIEVPAAGQPEDPVPDNNSATIEVIIDCVVPATPMTKVIVSISSEAEDQIAHPGAVVSGDEVWQQVNDPPPEAAGDPLPDGVPALPHDPPVPARVIQVKVSENFTLITNDLDWSEFDVWIDKTAVLAVTAGDCDIGDFELPPFDEPKEDGRIIATQVINEFEPEGFSVQPAPLLWDVHLVVPPACTLTYTLTKAPKAVSPLVFPPQISTLDIEIEESACTPPLVDLGLGVPDSDCDGAPDDAELGPIASSCGTRDPNDPWDFYNVPVPTLGRGGAMSDRDSAVTILSDVLGVLEYSGTSLNGPANGVPRDYDDDMDGDGYPDGMAYDRSVSTTGPWSGPPDDSITILTDVLLVLAQSGHGC